MVATKKDKKRSQDQIEGSYRLGRNSIGYVQTDDKQTIEVPAHHRNTALHRDRVRIRVTGTSERGRPEGQVLEILHRNKKGFAGIIDRDGDDIVVHPSDPKADFTISIKELPEGGSMGDKVFAIITRFDNEIPLHAHGNITKVLGTSGDNSVEMHAMALEQGFDYEFPAEVEEEAKKIKERGITEKDVEGRKDMRSVTTFTIDPDDAKDFDDALSFEKIDDTTFRIGIHIADVSYYVRPETALDREAYQRATSVYLVDRTIPMLPEILSNDLCSLRPNEDRLTYSAVFTIMTDGTITDEWFGRTVIHSDKRFTYRAAQDILDAGSGKFHEELSVLNTIAKKLMNKRFNDGALNMDQPEVRFLLHEDGKPIDVYTKERTDTHHLIEEFMLLANRRVARFMANATKKSGVFVYRVHDKPDPDRTQQLFQFLNSLGFRVRIKDGVIPPHDLQKIIDKVMDTEEASTVQTAIIRSMAKAVYTTDNIGHYGLSFKYYTHFTSPIRRYPDILVHRLLGYQITKSKDPHEKDPGYYEEAAKHSSRRERDAQEAEWDSIQYKQVEYMSERIGETFTGIITGATPKGIFVAEEKSRAEGLISMRDIPGGYYIFDEKKLTVRNQKTGTTYAIGDKITIRVKATNLERRMIDYELLVQ